jgi:hypothetical protein
MCHAAGPLAEALHVPHAAAPLAEALHVPHAAGLLAEALHVPHAAGPLAEAPLGEVRQSLEVNLVAPLHLAQLVRPRQPVVLYG